MRPVTLTISVLAAGIAGGVWWWTSETLRPPPMAPKKPDLPRPAEALRNLVDPASSIPTLALKVPQSTAPEKAEAPCEIEAEALVRTDLSAFLKNSDPSGLFVEVTDSKAFQQALEAVRKAGAGCSPTSETGGPNSPRARWRQICSAQSSLSPELREPLCAMELFYYRATVIDLQFTTVPLNATKDGIVVSNRLIAALTNGSSDPVAVATIADRLVEIFPDNGDAARYALDAHFQHVTRTGGETRSFERAVERIERLDPGGELATEGRLTLLRLKGDPGAMSRLAEEYETKHPESKLGPYYRAWATDLAGDRKKTVQVLETIEGSGIIEQYAAYARQQIAFLSSGPREGASPFSMVHFGAR